MTACRVTIELDEPQKIRSAGENVTGYVVIRCDKDVNCKALELSTRWSTHGRGNIDQGIGELIAVYSGMWIAGQEYRYPFKLATAAWPPTYYGTYLNVSHTVHGRAKIAWAIDPTAEVEIPVVALKAPEDLQPSRQQISGVGGSVLLVILGLLAVVFLFVFLWIVPFILIAAGIYWFFKKFLPKQFTGSIQSDLQPKRVFPGQAIAGTLRFTPKRNLKINEIRYKITCVENCVSGSGSNRTTHRHEVLSFSEQLAHAQVLPAGQEQDFKYEFKIPHDAAPSMKLSDNELKWNVEMRIDIPSWPDWSESFGIVVEPSPEKQKTEVGPEESWLQEVLMQLEQSSDAQRLELVLQAIKEHRFEVRLKINGKIEAPIDLTQEGLWLDAYLKQHDTYVALFIPRNHEASYPQTPNDQWRGSISIIGYELEDGIVIARAN